MNQKLPGQSRLLLRLSPFLIVIFLFVSALYYSDSFLAVLGVVALVFCTILLVPAQTIGQITALLLKPFKMVGGRAMKSKGEVVKPAVKGLKKSVVSKTDSPKALDNALQLIPSFNSRQLVTLGIVAGVSFVITLASFVYVALYSLPAVAGSGTLLFDYYAASRSGVDSFKTMGLLLLALEILAFSALLVWPERQRLNIQKKTVRMGMALGLSLIVSLLAFNAALPATLQVGQYKIKSTATALEADPKSMGMVIGSHDIAQKLDTFEKAPQVTQVDQVTGKTVLKMIVNQESRLSRFYLDTVASRFSDDKWPDVELPSDKMLLVSDTLFIRSLDEDELTAVAPRLGYLLVKQHFDPRNIKNNPDFEVINRQDYLKFRDDLINQEVAKIEAKIQEVNNKIGGLRANINRLYYQVFYEGLDIYEAIRRYDSYQAQMAQLYEEREILGFQKEIVASQKKQAPQELGIFLPEGDKIKVVLDETSATALDDFMAIVLHEYLHYTSYISDERYLLPFFEEGFTEYHARKVSQDQLGKDTHVGYVLVMKVINAMAEDLPEEKLADVYFNKDQEELQKLLNDTYGKDFYKETEYFFLMIPFSSFDQALEYANTIMEGMDKPTITEDEIKAELPEDIVSILEE